MHFLREPVGQSALKERRTRYDPKTERVRGFKQRHQLAAQGLRWQSRSFWHGKVDG